MNHPRSTPPDEERPRLKDLLYFSKSQRLALLVLLCIVLPAIPLLRRCAEKRQATADHRAAAFADSLCEGRGFSFAPTQEGNNASANADKASAPGSYPKAARAETFPFDPNRADSLTLRRLGLPPYVVRNLLRYRAKGGIIRTPEKFASIYGMSEADARRLAPYLQLEAYALKPRQSSPADGKPFAPTEKSTPRPRYGPAKYPPGTRIDLNKADTSELKRIRGIGTWRARAIANYRTRLGGFYSVEQLSEINNLPDSLQRSFFVATPPRRWLNLNQASLEELMRHPYLNYRQCRVILEHRRKRGPLSSLRPLLMYEEFTENDLRRLEPYVRF